MSADVLTLDAEGASATVALRGGEPMAWTVDGHDLLWHGDPAHWAFRAPILFPVVGSSSGGEVRVGGRAYPMPQHGFARHQPFGLVSQAAGRAHLRLTDTDATRAHYPFAFALDLAVALSATSLNLAFTVSNTGGAPMPYALGFHPAFPWPFADGARPDYGVVFSQAETGDLPGVTAAALLVPSGRHSPVVDRRLALDPALFTEALVFLDANSRTMTFESPDGAAIEMQVEGFPHLAVWTKPTAPFVSLEAWTGHADWDGFAGDLADRASMIVLAPGETRRHGVTLAYRPSRG